MNSFWQWLFDGTVPSNKKLSDGTVPSNKKLSDGTVPSNKKLYDGTYNCERDVYLHKCFKLCRLNSSYPAVPQPSFIPFYVHPPQF